MGWTKFFGDGQQIHEPESWSRTSLVDLIGVRLVHDNITLEIKGPGEYWQSDSYETEVIVDGSSQSVLTHRRIEKYIDGHSTIKFSDQKNLSFDFTAPDFNGLVAEEYIFHWLVLEVNVRTNIAIYYFSKERI